MVTGRGLVFAAAMAMLAAICVAPLVVLLAAPAWVGRWDAYRSAVLDACQIGLLVKSLRIAGAVGVVATVIGALLGFLLAGAPIVARNAVRLGLAVPVLIPTYALALSWIFATGAEGLVTRVLGLRGVGPLTYSPVAPSIVPAVAARGGRVARRPCSAWPHTDHTAALVAVGREQCSPDVRARAVRLRRAE